MRDVKAAVAAVLVAALASGCAVRAAPLPANHPARASAPVGRLAGAPASLRPGVVAYPGVPALRPDDQGGGHHHHHKP
jgi:hypothetical protein